MKKNMVAKKVIFLKKEATLERYIIPSSYAILKYKARNQHLLTTCQNK